MNLIWSPTYPNIMFLGCHASYYTHASITQEWYTHISVMIGLEMCWIWLPVLL